MNSADEKLGALRKPSTAGHTLLVELLGKAIQASQRPGESYTGAIKSILLVGRTSAWEAAQIFNRMEDPDDVKPWPPCPRCDKENCEGCRDCGENCENNDD